MKCLSLICLFCIVALCAEEASESDDAAVAKIAKTYIEASKLKSEAQVAREEFARNALKKAKKEQKKQQKEQRMEYLRKEKDIKLKQLMEKSSQMDKQRLEERINSFDKEVMQVAFKLAKKTAVQVPTVAGAEVVVTLAALNKGVHTEKPSFKITTNTGLTVDVPTLAAREIAVKVSGQVARKAEKIALKNLMNEAVLNPAASDKLIKMLFNKIYANDAARAKQKAFSRVEEMMKLPEGSLYKQYMEGVPEPSLTVARNANKNNKPIQTTKASDATAGLFKKSELNPKEAQLLSTYDVINGMDLTEEKEIPEGLLNVLNKDLRDKSTEEVESENESKLQKLKNYLFGK